MDRDAEQFADLLALANQGDVNAGKRIMELVYDELRGTARRMLAAEPTGISLEPTELVNELYLRLSKAPADLANACRNRPYFFAAAGEAMRRILIEHHRSKSRIKRGGEWQRVDLDDHSSMADTDPQDLECLGDALRDLGLQDSALATIVDLRYFMGLTMSAIAEAMDLPERSLDRRWAFARAWLRDRINSAKSF